MSYVSFILRPLVRTCWSLTPYPFHCAPHQPPLTTAAYSKALRKQSQGQHTPGATGSSGSTNPHHHVSSSSPPSSSTHGPNPVPHQAPSVPSSWSQLAAVRPLDPHTSPNTTAAYARRQTTTPAPVIPTHGSEGRSSDPGSDLTEHQNHSSSNRSSASTAGESILSSQLDAGSLNSRTHGTSAMSGHQQQRRASAGFTPSPVTIPGAQSSMVMDPLQPTSSSTGPASRRTSATNTITHQQQHQGSEEWKAAGGSAGSSPRWSASHVMLGMPVPPALGMPPGLGAVAHAARAPHLARGAHANTGSATPAAQQSHRWVRPLVCLGRHASILSM